MTGVRVRREPFGAIVYVPRRDRFFALDRRHTDLLLGARQPDGQEDLERLRRLGELDTRPRAVEGRSLLGAFTGLPVSRRPLVVNCFTTAHCPLRCTYCHADDLMVGYRDGEDESWLRDVIRVAAATPAMVGVVTGGEPLSRPDRAGRLIAALAEDKAVVLDTSGVGDFPRLVKILLRYGVHVRVSMDSPDAAVNDALRPVNRRYLPLGTSAHAHARDTVCRAIGAGLACSVQTVVTTRNGALEALLRFRDALVDLGVTTWALHIVVPAGKAAQPSRSRLLSGPGTQETLAELVRRSAAEDVPIDIRVTSTHRTPNSTLLISAKGELSVENRHGGEKTVMAVPRFRARQAILRRFREHVDLEGHAGRYLNGTLDPAVQTVTETAEVTDATPQRIGAR
jgi:MoaA/NifB/PqqE/SkfB family radical SAM enzyme